MTPATGPPRIRVPVRRNARCRVLGPPQSNDSVPIVTFCHCRCCVRRFWPSLPVESAGLRWSSWSSSASTGWPATGAGCVRPRCAASFPPRPCRSQRTRSSQPDSHLTGGYTHGAISPNFLASVPGYGSRGALSSVSTAAPRFLPPAGHAGGENQGNAVLLNGPRRAFSRSDSGASAFR